MTARSEAPLAIHGGPPLRDRPFAKWPEYGEEERAALSRVLDAGSWGGHPSPNTEALAFAGEFARYLDAAHVVPCANGTVAIQLALQAARVRPGAEVITTAYTFVATAGAIVAAGAVPVFVDVLPDSYCLDPDQVAAVVTDRTEAIVPVHLACGMADMDRIEEIARRHGLLVVEDCAHAHGARWRGRAAGTLGDLGTFSMQTTKLLTAGEGGAVVADDDTVAQRLWSLVNCGRKEPGYDRFPEQMLGQNSRITEWQAAVLRAQLHRLPEQHARRAARIAHFEKRLAAIPGLDRLPVDPRVTHRTAYQLIVRYDARAFADVPRDDVLAALAAEGVQAYGRFYVPLTEDPLFPDDPYTNPAARGGAPWKGTPYPIAARAAYEEAIWLPHPLFLGSEEDVDDLADALLKIQTHAPALAARPPRVAGGRR
jgi:dTDP-4-amino-4,6-dideoxygalactose transaminase